MADQNLKLTQTLILIISTYVLFSFINLRHYLKYFPIYDNTESIVLSKHNFTTGTAFDEKRNHYLNKGVRIVKRNKKKTDLFVIINCRNISLVPEWLEECTPPLCDYRVFVDTNENRTSLLSSSGVIPNSRNTNKIIEYPKHMVATHAYSSFGYRGRYQMTWAVKNADFDWLIKVDDDGYLCIQTLLHILRYNNAPKEKFIFGRFWCKKGFSRPDENFLAMSKDAVAYFVNGWKKELLLFHGRITLGNMIGVHLSRLHHKCGWTFWSDQEMFRWWSTIYPKHGCNSHIWFHHVTPIEIRRLHQKYKSQTTKTKNITITREEKTLYINHTGCKKFEMGLPTPSDEKISNLPMIDTRKGSFRFVDRKHVNFTSNITLPCEM